MSHLLRAKLLCLLSMTSLACTAYILYCKPIPQVVPSDRNQLAQRLESESGPFDRYLSYLNGGLSVLILLSSVALRDERGVHDGFWLLCTLPACKFLRNPSSKNRARTSPRSHIFRRDDWKAKFARHRPHRAGGPEIRV